MSLSVILTKKALKRHVTSRSGLLICLVTTTLVKVWSVAHREMITFCFLAAQGGCEPQLKAHVEGNLNVGNSKQYLINIASQCVPYIGYPRTLNALRLHSRRLHRMGS